MSRMSAEPPAAVSLAGAWRLDPRHSTDSGKALDALLRSARRGMRARRHAPMLGERGPAGAQGSASSADDALLDLDGPLNTFPPDISLQKSLLAGGDWLRIDQRPDALVITNAETSRSFVPGERSVVSVPSGVADQRSGWKGREYWIELKPQVGPSATEKFKLSADGKQLIETIEVGSEGRIPRLDVTRVYVPAHDLPAAPLPSDD